MSSSVLGISDDYVGNVTLFVDGRPVFALANERLSRHKGDAGFPDLALEAALEFAGLSLDEVDRVVVANRTHFVYRLLRARFKDHEHDFFDPKQKLYLRYHDVMFRSRVAALAAERLNARLLRRKLRRKVALCDHHRAHACSGVATSGFDSCLVVTLDNLGDGCSATVHEFRDGRLTCLQRTRASDSPGQFYGEVTQLLGFNPLRHAGKVTGLAAHGDPEAAAPIVEGLFCLSDDGCRFRMPTSAARWRSRGAYWRLSLLAPEDVAAAAQRRLEQVVAEHVRLAMERTGHDRLVLAGGVVANVRLNRVLGLLPGVREVHVHPAMSDEGLSFGAVAAHLADRGELRPIRLDSVFLGPGFDDGAAVEALGSAGLPHRRMDDPAEVPARLLAGGHVVARCTGRLEYGPRALGNRSILVRPDDPTVNDWLNGRLRRTEFMPFAPMTRWEDAGACYTDMEPFLDPLRFMTVAVDATDEMRRLCPGAVHVDGTARPQLVREERDPELHRLLTRFGERTGLPSLINTSLNVHEEPIACSPEDAIAAFLDADLDFLALGGHIVRHPRRPDLEEPLDDACPRDQ